MQPSSLQLQFEAIAGRVETGRVAVPAPPTRRLVVVVVGGRRVEVGVGAVMLADVDDGVVVLGLVLLLDGGLVTVLVSVGPPLLVVAVVPLLVVTTPDVGSERVAYEVAVEQEAHEVMVVTVTVPVEAEVGVQAGESSRFSLLFAGSHG